MVVTRFASLPVDGPISAEFNRTDDVHAAPHSGVDIAAPEGAEVRAPAAGYVVFVSFAQYSGWAETFGNSVVIDHGDCFTLYAHLRDAPAVTVGNRVDVGDLLGYVGNTGHSFGPHLHWGMAKPDNRWFDKTNDLAGLLDPLAFVERNDSISPHSPTLEATVEIRALDQAESIDALNRAAEAHGKAINDNDGFTIVEVVSGSPVPLQPGQRAYLFVTN